MTHPSDPDTPPINWAGRLLRIALIAALAGMIGASMTMNVVAGAGLMESAFYSFLLVVVFLASDGIKVHVLFWFNNAIRNGSLWHAALCVLLGALTVSFSLFSAYTFGISERFARLAQADADDKKSAYVERQLADANKTLGARRTTRTVAEIEAERRAILNEGLRSERGTIGDYTQNCTNPTPRTRTRCDRYNELGTELAAARAAEEAAHRRKKMEDEAMAAWEDAKPADTQLAALSELTGYSERSILQAMAWFLALLTEFGSIVGLYLANKLSAAFRPKDPPPPGAGRANAAADWPQAGGPQGDVICPLANRNVGTNAGGIRELSNKDQTHDG
jgi:hypothetical protein